VKILPGLLLAIAIAAVATLVGHLLPVVGAPVVAIALGLLITAVRAPGARLHPGILFSTKQVLAWSIVLLGTQLRFTDIVAGGLKSLPVMLSTLVVVLALAYIFGKLLGIDRDLRRLLGVGTAICGGSAIAALASAVESDRADVAYALSTIFFFNVAAVLTFPTIGHLMHLSQHAFGLWAGTAINDTSSVVAAAFVYGHAAGQHAVIVKLTRTTLIIPLVAFYAGKRAFAMRGGEAVPWRSIIPWFVLWFVVAAGINSFGYIPAAWHAPLDQLALFAITVALAAVGLSADYARIRSAGIRPLLLGAILWVGISLTSLGVAHAMHLN